MRTAILILAMAIAAPAQAPRTFSHRLHLQLKLECTTCHAAAPASTRVEDHLLPSPEVCRTCHQTTPPFRPAARKPPLLAHFSHQQHLKMGNIAPVIAAAIDSQGYLSPPGGIRAHLNSKNPCQACHRGLEESSQVTPANLPQMADCLVCHNKIDAPFSCEQCHARNARLKPANHTPDFLDTHTSGKLNLDKSTCALCHGRRFTCLGCH